MNRKTYADGYEKQPDGSFSKPAKGTIPGCFNLPAPEMKHAPLTPRAEQILDTAVALLAQISGVKTFTVKTTPIGAPRMTQRDKWKKRPCVMKYFTFRDKVRAAVGKIDGVPDRMDCEFYFPMPESWSKAKKLKLAGTPHCQVPDCDNLWKAVADALFDEDSAIHQASQLKRWCWPGQERVEIKFTYNKP